MLHITMPQIAANNEIPIAKFTSPSFTSKQIQINPFTQKSWLVLLGNICSNTELSDLKYEQMDDLLSGVFIHQRYSCMCMSQKYLLQPPFLSDERVEGQNTGPQDNSTLKTLQHLSFEHKLFTLLLNQVWRAKRGHPSHLIITTFHIYQI